MCDMDNKIRKLPSNRKSTVDVIAEKFSKSLFVSDLILKKLTVALICKS